MTGGWIKFHRRFMDHESYQDSEFMHALLHLLLKATHAPIERTFNGQRIVLQPGQLISGRNAISRETGINPSKIRRVMKRLQNDQLISQQSGNLSSLITILNWDADQSSDHPIGQPTTSKRPLTRREELKKDSPSLKNLGADSKELSPSLKEIQDYASSIALPAAEAERFFDYFEQRGWNDRNGQPVRNWKAAIRRWKTTGHGSGFVRRPGGEPAPVVANYDDPNDPLTGKRRS